MKQFLRTMFVVLCCIGTLTSVPVQAADGSSESSPVTVTADGFAFSGGTIYGIDADWFQAQLPAGQTEGHLYVALEIPAEVDGRDVTAISPFAFTSSWSTDKEKYHALNYHNYGHLTFTIVSADFSQASCLRSIGNQSFMNSSISGVLDLSQTPLERFEKMAFNGCDNLTGVVLPDTLQEIGPSCFLDCTGLRFVTTQDIYAAFGDALVDFTLPDGLKVIDNRAFASALEPGLDLVAVIPASVETIGEEAFYNKDSKDLRFTQFHVLRTDAQGLDGYDYSAFKWVRPSGSDALCLIIMADEDSYNTFRHDNNGLSYVTNAVTHQVSLSFEKNGVSAETQDKLWNQSVRFTLEDDVWVYDTSYTLPETGGTTAPGYESSVWIMDDKVMTEDTLVTALTATLRAGGDLTDPEVSFQVTIVPNTGSETIITVPNGGTVTMNLRDDYQLKILPIFDHPLSGEDKDDVFFWYCWNDSEGTRNGESAFSFGKTINTLKIQTEDHERTGTSFYQLDLEGKTVSSAFYGPDYDWDKTVYTSEDGMYYLYVEIETPTENLDYITAHDYQWFIDRYDQYQPGTIYNTAEEFIQQFLLPTFGSETEVGSDAGNYTYLDLTWSLTSGTTYSTEPGAENHFTWQISEAEFAQLGWTNTTNIPLSGEIVLTNPYAVTFQADGTTVDTLYAKKNTTLTTADFPAVPEKTGYRGSWEKDTLQVTENVTIHAVYTPIVYDITYDLDGGTNGNNPDTYTVEDDIVLENPKKSGYTFQGWTYQDGQTPVKNLTLTAGSITGSLCFTAHWEKTSSGGDDTVFYTITASAKNGGSISPKGNITVAAGNTQTFRITAEEGYILSDVTVDGKSIGAQSTYTFRDIQKHHTITAFFTAVVSEEKPQQTGVSDWLNMENHMAYLNGYPDGTFRPGQTMTRAEAAQMFYNLLTQKDVPLTMSFRDVPEDAWYAKAVRTLASLGLVSGMGDGRFAPDQPITRAEFAAMAMAFTNTQVAVESPFPDVAETDWYYEAVSGAAQFGWINGYEDGTFRPGQTITRAEVASMVNAMLERTADEAFIAENAHLLRTFADVPAAHWAYNTILEAANSHTYTKTNGTETWTIS